MSKFNDKVLKRHKWPVPIGNETVYIRAPTKSEKREAAGIEDAELQGYFMLGCACLNDDGTLAYPRSEGESAVDFASRVQSAMEDVPEDVTATIVRSLTRIQTAPESLPKN